MRRAADQCRQHLAAISAAHELYERLVRVLGAFVKRQACRRGIDTGADRVHAGDREARHAGALQLMDHAVQHLDADHGPDLDQLSPDALPLRPA
jgi:hypothetical protein